MPTTHDRVAKNLLAAAVPTNSLAYTVAQAAVLAQVSEKTIRRLIARGDLQAVRFGRQLRIPGDALRRSLGKR